MQAPGTLPRGPDRTEREPQAACEPPALTAAISSANTLLPIGTYLANTHAYYVSGGVLSAVNINHFILIKLYAVSVSPILPEGTQAERCQIPA